LEPSIVQNFYPYTYKTNLLEQLDLMRRVGCIEDPRCADALALLRAKQGRDGMWRAEVSFMKSTWVEFEPLKQPGPWISYIARRITGEDSSL
jgi:hypothetical protein